MRVVAKVQFTSTGTSGRKHAAETIEEWTKKKFVQAEGGDITILRSGAPALFERVDVEAAGFGQTQFTMLEPVTGGSLQTEVRIVATSDRTAVSTVLSLGSDFGVAPLDVALRAPKFIRSVVAGERAWTVGVGGERVLAAYVTATETNLDELIRLIEFQHRRLPIVLVSEYDGQTLAGDIHEHIANDLCGLAHVVRIRTEAAWELTKRWGAQWSCYNGAVRIMWPMRGERGDPRAHPLWTMDRLMAYTDDQATALDRLRHAIGRRILEASTYVSDDSALGEFIKAAARASADKARATAAASPDPSKTAYEEQIEAQRKEIDLKDAEILTLTQNVESLSMALRSMRPTDINTEEEAPTQQAEPQSVQEAVAIARRELQDKVEIAGETDADIDSLNSEAGPPEKILRYLRTMGDLADRLAEGPLGISVPKWLRERGVECSGDSETSKNSGSGKNLRNRPVNGRRVDCEFHAKPNEGTSLDRCTRIYFSTSPKAPHVLVGYIGRHFE